jgi:hypothetical protein
VDHHTAEACAVFSRRRLAAVRASRADRARTKHDIVASKQTTEE